MTTTIAGFSLRNQFLMTRDDGAKASTAVVILRTRTEPANSRPCGDASHCRTLGLSFMQ